MNKTILIGMTASPAIGACGKKTPHAIGPQARPQ